MNSDDLDGERPLAWFTSSYSNGAGGECVEGADDGDRIFLRDTKIGDALVTVVGAPAWHSFTHAIRQGWPTPP
ncbi:DUF397 domain-containing protein [Streptomyces fumanus]|uniref:DUF397 domain-containing protein n=1 Tax=Streptomyces fumanus TaxID=67302 RepID=A0A919A3W8_9ACTN|nr:DUF397 domain-containing protein [Streptomyces fumanus]GHE86234.1 hypothetical protein GCM10018772_07270 [Streptomyces fumanus]